jgi:hypothetical protein
MTLADRLARGPMRGDEARRIAWEICAALRGPHAAGALHRDLKPHNVFLTAQGVKLLDFGAAKGADDPGLTAASRVLGTPGYIAPEVWEGDPADPRSDLYAVGAMFFEMIAGQRAFPVEEASMLAALQRAPQDLRLARRLASKEDAAIVARALAPDPEERFLTARQIMRALEGGPLAPLPPPALRYARGEHDVVVHQVVNLLAPLRRDVGVGALLRRLDAPAPRRWRWRLAGAGEATLVAGASRPCAEAVAAVCAEYRVPATTVRESRQRSPAEAWLARRGAFLLVLLASCVAVAATALLGAGARDCAFAGAAAAALGYFLSWGLRPALSLSPLRDLPERTTAADRFAAGLVRRARALERKALRLPSRARSPLHEAALAARASAERARAHRDDPVTADLLECAANADDLLDALRRQR